MSKKGGQILNDLWNRVDQAGFDQMIGEAFDLLPTKIQKRFIKEILDNDSWDLNGEPDPEDKERYRKYIQDIEE